ncbi:MAG: ferredoxin--NADP reductase [Myxococcota bacterium]
MGKCTEETVLSIHHWNDSLFSFKTTRQSSLRFTSGQFIMIGLKNGKKQILRAYSFANPFYSEELEFYSIKVQDGALTSRLQHIKEGDTILVGSKPTGTLVLSSLHRPGRNLFLLATGTGLAPFMSIVRDPEAYERYERVVLVHGVRQVSDLGYHDYLQDELKEHPLVGEDVAEKLLYYPTVTREPFRNQGRITDLITSGKLLSDLELDDFDATKDAVMVCGSPTALKDITAIFKEKDFKHGLPHAPSAFSYERAFVES